MATRFDLVAELDTTLDGSGDYTGPWIDSSNIYKIRIVNVGSGMRIEESNNQTDIVQVNTVGIPDEGLPYNAEEVLITSRYFRIRGYGDPNAPIHASVRIVN